ncbi:TonB-dependent receptor, partial [bacterium]|nr:TonB-dependent receptor [bacterium]
GRIQGKITDSSTGSALPGANVFLRGTNYGAASDLRGAYLILGVPSGSYTLVVSYIGYEQAEIAVAVVGGDLVTQNIALESAILKTKDVVVTAQAEGQMQAINQQISSKTSKNIVSSKKIQELPESNAAEAVGRLPGVSLQREGGEGNKVVIRGLSPRYSKVQMEGVSLAATGDNDRSTDLSMISPYMLDGIELQKAATADQEADQLGGTINFRLKEAPERPTLNAVAQGGYNDLRDKFEDYKFVLAGSNRFFNQKLGIFANVDVERKDRSDNSAFAGYEIQDEFAIANSLGFQDINRTRKRFGGTVVLDYRLPSTKLKLFTTYNSADSDVEILRELYNVGNAGDTAREHRYIAIDSSNTLTTMTNSLRLEQYLGNVKLTGGISYARAKQEIPNALRFDGVEESAFTPSFNFETPTVLGDLRGFLVEDDRGFLHPSEFITKANNDTSAIFVDWIFNSQSETIEDQFALDLNFEFSPKISDLFDLTIKLGGKYKHKNKEFDFESFEHAMWWSTVDVVREDWAGRLSSSPFLDGYVSTQNTRFPYGPFIDTEFDGSDFLAGNFEINRVPNVDMVKEFLGTVERSNQGNAFGLTRNFNVSIPNDYDGNEDYFAGYIMPTLEFGNSFTLIPGVRFEHNDTKYGGNRTAALGQWDDPFVYDSVATSRQNDFILPMIHGKLQVTDWLDIRASYTQTISRPSYNLIIPSWQIIPERSLNWNNPFLEPIESDNVDVALSFYGDKIGLFTLGTFHKNISNFIYGNTTFIVEESQLIAAYPDNVAPGGQVTGFINNPNDATVLGLEVDWQSNLWFLPGVLRGLVVNFNYTYTHSELVYPLVTAVFETTPFGGRRIVGSEDSSYEAPLIDQPDHLLNLIIGYDYKGFSMRWSMRYKSDVFLQDHFFPELRVFSEPLTLYDLSIKQQLPLKGLQLYSNTSNLSRAIDTTTNQGTGWFASREFYGITSEIGLRYDF